MKNYFVKDKLMQCLEKVKTNKRNMLGEMSLATGLNAMLLSSQISELEEYECSLNNLLLTAI
jgi:hypothetical protein